MTGNVIDTLSFWVDEETEERSRLDRFLTAECEGQFSRERIQQLIKSGCVTVNDKAVSKPSTSLKLNDDVQLNLPEPEPMVLAAEDISLEILFEDEHLLVVNKPSGMLTHPTGREATGTLVNALLFHCKGKLSGINGIQRPGIVHRLDRQTSGLLMVAKSEVAHRHLSQQIKERSAKRQYLAVVQGQPDKESGTVEASLGRNPKRRDLMMIREDGRPSVTHWQVLEFIGNKFSLVQLNLETGRTHQIRVHMASIGHPVFGDPFYGTGIEKVTKIKTDGQLLQAVKLSFVHPISAEVLIFELPMCPEMLQAIEQLKALNQ